MSRLKVFIPTLWRGPENEFGATLVFKTIRVGFPTAEIIIIDSNSPSPYHERLKELAEGVGARFFRIASIGVGQFVRDVIIGRATRDTQHPIVFIDSDMVFWENCEDLVFPEGTLYAGRFQKELIECGCRMAPRIHTSFFWVPNPKVLMDRVTELAGASGEMRYISPFIPFTFRDGNDWRMFDVGASLYAMAPEGAYCFGENELNRYDHLVSGTMTDILDPLQYSTPLQKAIRSWHERAKEDLGSVRGIWREQQALIDGQLLEKPGWNFAWNYYCGKLWTKGKKKEFALTSCEFAIAGLEQFIHASVTELDTGVNHQVIIAATGEAPTYIDEPSLAMSMDGSSSQIFDHGKHETPSGSWSYHESSPKISTRGHLRLGEFTYEIEGELWRDQEHGYRARGTGWTWLAISLDDSAVMVYAMDGEIRLVQMSMTRTERTEVSVQKTGRGWLVSYCGGRSFVIRRRFWPNIIEDTKFSGITYEETFCDVYDAETGERIGYAFAEVVPAEKTPKQKTLEEQQADKYFEWAAGNVSAAALIEILAYASQTADDFVDAEITPEESSARMVSMINALTSELQGNEFFMQNSTEILSSVQSALHWWHASNVWSKDQRTEAQAYAYVQRESFAQVIWKIAYLAGGESHARKVLLDIFEFYHQPGAVESLDRWRLAAKTAQGV